MYLSITLENGKQIQDRLNLIGTTEGMKIIKSALRKSQNICLKQCRRRARWIGGVMGKKIAKALKLVVGKRKMKGSAYFSIILGKDPDFIHETKSGKRRWKNPKSGRVRKIKGKYFIPAAIEFGHISPSGKFVRPMSFMRDPSYATKGQRLETFRGNVSDGLDKAMEGKFMGLVE
jgi:hypothetical protein